MTQAVAIEIDIFSGRPNPVVQVTGEQAKQLLAILKRARPRSGASAADEALGFRGFIVKPEGGGSYRVKGDAIASATKVFADPGQEAQAYIVGLLPAELRALVTPFLGPAH